MVHSWYVPSKNRISSFSLALLELSSDFSVEDEDNKTRLNFTSFGTLFGKYCHFPPGGGVLPYKGLMGTCGQPGYVFGIFVLNRVSILSFFFCLNQGIDFVNFCLEQVSF